MDEIREFRSNTSDIPRQPEALCLAAIVVGDISGCSRPTRSDESGMRRRIQRIERELVEPRVVEHHGRLVKTTADGFVAIFDSPVEAARCSIMIQQSMVERSQSLSRHPTIEYRIGVSLGDVITDPDDICGEGVHIASRLAAIAGAGQVCISGGIYEQIKPKLFYGYESLGDRKVKNIAGRVTVYRMLPDPDAFHRIRRRREIFLISLLSLTLLVIASGGIWYLFGQTHRNVVATQALNHQERARVVQSVFVPTHSSPRSDSR